MIGMLKQPGIRAALLLLVALCGSGAAGASGTSDSASSGANGGANGGMAGASEASEAIRLVAADERGLILELTLPTWELTDCVYGGNTFQRIDLPGWGRSVKAGLPDLPRLGILIEVPDAGAIDCDVTEHGSTRHSGIAIRPAPRQRLAGGGAGGAIGPSTNERDNGAAPDLVEEYVPSKRIFGSNKAFPGKLVTIGQRAVVRGVPVARVLFHPFQWNPSTGVLHAFETIRVRIRFEEPLAVAVKETAGSLPAGGGGNLGGADVSSADRQDDSNRRPVNGDRLFDRMLDGLVINRTHRTCGRSTAPQPCTTGRASRTGLRMEIVEDGFYRLTYDDLIAAGVNPATIDPRTFQVEYLGNEMAIDVTTASSQVFAPGDTIDFYGEKIEWNIFTETNVYWLYWGGANGARMAWQGGKVTGRAKAVDHFRETIRVQEDNLIWDQTPGAPAADYWFWETWYAPFTGDYYIDVPAPDPAQVNAVLRVRYQGRSTAPPHPNHHTKIYLNGSLVGDEFWDGDTAFTQEMVLPAGVLLDGSNKVTVELPNDTGAPIDILDLNWIELEYDRGLVPLDDEMTLTADTAGRVRMTVGTLSHQNALVYDISDRLLARKICDFTILGEGGAHVSPQPVADVGRATVVFEADINGLSRYHVMAADRFRSPAKLELWQHSDLKNPTNGADYIVVTSRDCVPAVASLEQFRTGQGFRVAVVAMEDLYNEFNHGLFHPDALKAFLQHAYDHWTSPAPGYVFLLGDSNADYRDKYNTGKSNVVPVHLYYSDAGVIPNPNWFVCVDGGDRLPDMLLGRASADGAGLAGEVAAKLVQYDQATGYVQNRVVLAADDETGFETLSDNLVPYLPSGIAPDKIYLSGYTSTNTATQDIIAGIDAGAMFTTYTGHGSLFVWAAEKMFQISDIGSLNNSHHLTFVLTYTCLNGYFSNIRYYCIADEFFLAKDRGAIGCFSPTGFGYLWEHELLSEEVFGVVYLQQQKGMGEMTTRARLGAYAKGASLNQLEEYTLFGDPTCELKDW